ncbi:DUF551 domain-containing protein [Enterocloster citroniae]|uniref:DUF551 domain-containing protein n=1 Tax=[Clostridium] citroniae WAL-17108 TaxID=742733 RepID=G5HEP8_9FIRM|nr:DUF551 domain-containing protein [Enterocloster citroniae]EHF00007.1 hypothetical protein HMPREF9469_00921 [ [[Clostridium] citroniae WAL-17108]MCC3383266.1 DUF551 domain-containing protein [Enterocloster citroniae]
MRLTQKDDQGNWSLRGVKWEQLHVGQTITQEVSEKLYGALWKLMEYEGTDQIEELNNFEKPRTAHCLAAFQEEQWKQRWISVMERLPQKEVRVLVTIMHHKWIADPRHRDQCTHPEWLETCEARYIDEKEWEYADQECEYEMTSAFSALGDLNHIFYPIDEVLAWMPLPEPFKGAE